MNRFIGALLVAVVGIMLSMPTAILVRFQWRRAYVERELCVQREVIAEMRTCHGECHLSKQLKALEHKSEQGFPAERFQERFEPLVGMAFEHTSLARNPVERVFPVFVERVLPGHFGTLDAIPRG
jgi:hypothetical protein